MYVYIWPEAFVFPLTFRHRRSVKLFADTITRERIQILGQENFLDWGALDTKLGIECILALSTVSLLGYGVSPPFSLRRLLLFTMSHSLHELTRFNWIFLSFPSPSIKTQLSGFGGSQRLDSGGHLRRAVLWYLPSVAVQVMANTEPFVQGNRCHLDRQPCPDGSHRIVQQTHPH